VVRVTDRRLKEEPRVVVELLRRLLVPNGEANGDVTSRATD
jgi:hypothetical protein